MCASAFPCRGHSGSRLVIRPVRSRIALGLHLRRVPLGRSRLGFDLLQGLGASGLVSNAGRGLLSRSSVACWRIRLRLFAAVVRVGSLVAGYLVDPASSHMLVSKIKPCMSKYKRLVL